MKLDAETRYLLETGLVREQWKPAGSNIEYTKSSIERTGWSIPGPLNIDDEEDENADQDDLQKGPNSEDGEAP